MRNLLFKRITLRKNYIGLFTTCIIYIVSCKIISFNFALINISKQSIFISCPNWTFLINYVYNCFINSLFYGFCFSEEFVAHTPNVNCLALGHKSGRVLVTGGDDKKVNLWAVGKQNCIMVSKQWYNNVTIVKFEVTSSCNFNINTNM